MDNTSAMAARYEVVKEQVARIDSVELEAVMGIEMTL